MPRIVRVFEYEKLTIHKDDQDRFLTPKELIKLYDFNGFEQSDATSIIFE